MPKFKSIDLDLKDKKRYHYNDFKARQRKLRWTFILVPIYILLVFLIIFYGHKLDGFGSIIFLLCLVIPIGVTMMWVGINSKSKWQEFISFIKIMLIAAPFCFPPLDGPSRYKKYNLQKYKTITSGIVTNTYSKYYSRGWTTSYWADINYYFNGQTIRGKCSMNSDEYKVGDSVLVIYSSDIPEFYELAGIKN
jgi:hypothetical protein